MGNINYKGKVIDNLDATDIPDKTNVDRVAAILGVDLQALIDALTSKTIFAQGETVVSKMWHEVICILDEIGNRIQFCYSYSVFIEKCN